MNDSQLLERLAATDAYAPGAPLPSSARTRNAAIAEIERRADMQTQKRTVPPVPPHRTRSGWLAAAAAFVIVLVVGAAMVFWAAQGDEDVIEPTTTTSAVPTTLTTVPPPPEPVPPMVDAWQRVGGALMGPVVGTSDMIQAGSRLVVVGFDPGEDDFRQNGVIFASDDGINWERLAENDPALTQGWVLMYAITEGGPGLVAVGSACEDDTEACSPYATAWTSVDGASWTRTSHDPAVFGDPATETTGMTDVVTTNAGSLVAVGWLDDWTLDDSGFGESVVTNPAVWTSPDGVVWERAWLGEGFELTAGIWNDVLTPPMHAIAEDPNGGLTAVGAMLDQDAESTAAVWTSQDGSTWERVAPTSPAFGRKTAMTDITWGSSGYVAVGTEDDTTPAIWISPDGHSWARVDISDQPFEITSSLGSVAALESGYIAVGPSPMYGDVDGGVTLWTSPDGTTWDRVHAVGGEGYASAVVVADGGFAVAGSIPGLDNVHASVWIGPLFDPEAPPPDPGPPEVSAAGDGSPVDPTTIDPADVGHGYPQETPTADEYAALDTETARVFLEDRSQAPDSPRLDFLAGLCNETGCYRDAMVVDPDDDEVGSGGWAADAPFHIRHGFVTDAEDPLNEDFNVIVYATRREGPELDNGVFEIDQPYRLDADYLLRGTTDKCGPGYWDQTGTYECDWIVYELAEGLPQGRYDIWAGWYAPCSTWLELGIVEACDVPAEVSSQFASAVNMPFYGEDYTEGMPPPYDAATMLAGAGPITRGWPSD